MGRGRLHERRLLHIGSPLFHFDILVVLLGHIGRLVIPKSWTETVGISALLLFAAWPLTRLVHIPTAPVGYLTRPYIATAWGHERSGAASLRRIVGAAPQAPFGAPTLTSGNGCLAAGGDAVRKTEP